MRILGIESSCDDTAAAIVQDGLKLLSNQRFSSAAVQQRYGGVVPEVAAREHTLAVLPVVQSAMAEAGLTAQSVDAVAVTQGPGLMGALLVGVTFAKALGLCWHIPVVGVHHLEAHLYANALVEPIQFPNLALIVSGGHTTLVHWRGHADLVVLGNTRDDAAGEAFDKGARLLGLPYPGGPEIEALAQSANQTPSFSLPIARLGESLDFSFSGLKTAFDEWVHRHPTRQAEAALALETAVVTALVRNLARAHQQYPVAHVYLAGGVAANRRLSRQVREWGESAGVAVHIPPVDYCTDNGAMVAAAGFYRWQRGHVLAWDAGPKTPWPLADV